MSAVSIRRAEQRDLPALLAIYNHYIVNTPITFDIEPRTLSQRQEWLYGFAQSGRHQCFVAVKDDLVIGWACSGKFKEKAAYETSIETSVYLAAEEQGRGIGRLLYETLFDALKHEDIHRAYAGITQPNPASSALHRAFDFVPIGTQSEVGRKFGRFWDVTLFEKVMTTRA